MKWVNQHMNLFYFIFKFVWSVIYGIATHMVHLRVNTPNRCFFVGLKVWVTAVSENELLWMMLYRSLQLKYHVKYMLMTM